MKTFLFILLVSLVGGAPSSTSAANPSATLSQTSIPGDPRMLSKPLRRDVDNYHALLLSPRQDFAPGKSGPGMADDPTLFLAKLVGFSSKFGPRAHGASG